MAGPLSLIAQTLQPFSPRPRPATAAEDELRASGVPFAIVRPVALTEEPAGMPLVLEQGDTLKGKVSREVGSMHVLASFGRWMR